MSLSELEKSTIVRSSSATLAAAERLAPGLAARWVCRQWFRLPPGPRPRSVPDGGEPFSVEWEHGRVRGLTWGDGPVVYLVHGWGGRADQFAALVERLARSGYSVVVFDGPSHGASEPGAFGPASTTGVEFAKALDAVFARFGPGEAVVAHSMGTLVTLLALRFGWLGVDRLVFVAPMSGYRATMAAFQAMLGFGPRTRRRVDSHVWQRVGLAPEEFEVRSLWSGLSQPLPTLVVQDAGDPQAPYSEARAIAQYIGAELMTTTGLGHNRVLNDPAVLDRIIGFLGTDNEALPLPDTA